MTKIRTVDFQEQGDTSTMRVEVRQDNTPVAMLAQWIKGLPPEQRTFFKDCRIVSVLPVYLPQGAFQESEHVYSLDPDQLDWAVKNFGEFRAVDDTANNHLSTGRHIAVSMS